MAGMVLILALILAAKFWAWPSWKTIQEIDEISERLPIEIELIKTLSQTMLGALVVVTLYFTWRRVSAAEQAGTIAREGQITERFTRAVEQLGNKDNMAVRLGGIYALERIARDSERDHWQVMEVLTAFAREKSPHCKDKPCIQPIAADIQAILTVLGRRNPKYDWKGLRLDLSDTHLHGARLLGANLEHVMLTGANLRNASFFRVNFRGAIFQDTILQGTVFQKSRLIDCYFERAIMQEADLQGSDITNADLREARHLTEEQVKSANKGRSAQLPADLRDIWES